MLGISPDALRYYEKCGLLRPTVDPSNHYRMYSDLDAITLFDIRQNRGMKLSVQDIGQQMDSSSIDGQLNALENRASLIDEQIQELQLLKQRCNARIRTMQTVQENLGRIREVQCPPAYHLPYQLLRDHPSDQTRQLVKQWIDAMPFVGFFLSVSPGELRDGPLNLHPGLSASLRYVGEFTLPINPPVRAMMGGWGIEYTFFTQDPFSLTYRDILPMINYVREHRYVINDDVCFSVDFIEYCGGVPLRYYLQIHVPVIRI